MTKAFFHAIVLAMSFRACSRTGNGSLLLAGEWRVRLESTSRSDVSLTSPVEGAFVFDRRITQYGYGESGMPLPMGASLGRAYLPLSPAERQARSMYRAGPDADALEEVMAIAPGDGLVQFEFSPKFSHGGLRFQGRVSGDSVSGEWTRSIGRGGHDRGTFKMWRVPPTAATDSAIVRSRRGARMWANSRIR
jgi:hypothetical protein